MVIDPFAKADVSDAESEHSADDPANDGIAPEAPPINALLAKVVFELTQRLDQFSSAEELLDTVANEVAALIPHDRVAIVLHSYRGRAVNLRISRGDQLDFRPGHRDETTEGVRLASLVEPLLYDIVPDGPFIGDTDRWDAGYRRAAVAPLRIGAEPIGLFTIMSKQADALSDADLWVLSSMASALGVMLAATDLRLQAEQGQREAEFLAMLGEETVAIRSESALLDVVAHHVNVVFSCTAAAYRVQGEALSLVALHAAPGMNANAARVLATSLLEISESPVRQALAIPMDQGPFEIRATIDGMPTMNPLLAGELIRRGVDALIAMPIIWNDTPLGVIGVSHNTHFRGIPAIPWERHGDILRRVAQMIAPILENIRLHESLTRILSESEMLRSILGDTARRSDPAEGLDILARSAHLLYGADYVGIGQARDGQTHWVVQVGSRHPEQRRATMLAPHLQLAVNNLTPVMIRDLHDPSIGDPDRYPLHQLEGLRASLAIPFEIDGGGKGVFLVGYRTPRQFDTADIRFARSLGATVAALLLADPDQA